MSKRERDHDELLHCSMGLLGVQWSSLSIWR